MVHVEVAGAGTRRAVPGRVARGLAACASSEIRDVCERMRRDAPHRLDDEGDDARALDEERVVVVAAHFRDVALARVW